MRRFLVLPLLAAGLACQGPSGPLSLEARSTSSGPYESEVETTVMAFHRTHHKDCPLAKRESVGYTRDIDGHLVSELWTLKSCGKDFTYLVVEGSRGELAVEEQP